MQIALDAGGSIPEWALPHAHITRGLYIRACYKHRSAPLEGLQAIIGIAVTVVSCS